MATQAENLVRDMLLVMSQAILRQARVNLRGLATDSRKARALRNDLKVSVLRVTELEGTSKVATDFYWAVYYHDGRGPIHAKPGKFLVFFRDPDLDPRHGGPARSYPRRASDIRRLRLPPGEFRRLLQAGLIIATKRVGPAEGHPFFEIGMRAAQKRYGPQVSALFSKYVLETLAAEDLLDGEEEITFEL